VSDDVPPANTPLQITWNEYESFRSALRALLQLGPEPLAQLARDDIIDYPVPETLEARSVPTPAPVIAFLQFLRSALSQYESVDLSLSPICGDLQSETAVLKPARWMNSRVFFESSCLKAQMKLEAVFVNGLSTR
jgi:hypothetical protein